MKNLVNSYAERFLHQRKIRRRLTGLLLILAAVTAGGVFWQLRSTGVALVNETNCGYEQEHQHGESCRGQVLVCPLREDEGDEGHTHGPDCYESVEKVICTRQESEGHSHGADCFDEEGTLICEREESEGHVHGADCRQKEEVLCCGQEEREAYEGHTHTAECYEEMLVCEIPEHTHSESCLSDEGADVEDASDWEATLPACSGVWADDVVAVAASQIGYAESASNFQLADDGETRRGYTRYGAWYGNPYGDWCAMFASFCLHYAGIPEQVFPEEAGAYNWTVELNGRGLFASGRETVPASGDLIFFDSDADGRADHVGIVREAQMHRNAEGEEFVGKITTIEGNSDDAVREHTYQAGDGRILGYGRLPAQTETAAETDSKKQTDETPAEEKARVQAIADSASTFSVTWMPVNNRTATITVNVYDTEGNALPAESAMTTLTTTGGGGSEGNPYTSSLNVPGLADTLVWESGSAEDNYRFVYATAVISNRTYGDESDSVASIDLGYYTTGSLFSTSHWNYGVKDGSGTLVSASAAGNSFRGITLNLYYGKPTTTITVTPDETNDACNLTAEDRYFSGAPVHTWTVSDESLARLVCGEEGSASLVWAGAKSGDRVTVTVTATFVRTDGNGKEITESATDCVEVTYGLIPVVIHVTYNKGTTAVGAHVAVHDADGNQAAAGTTDAEGNLSVLLPYGVYTVDIEHEVTSGRNTTIWYINDTEEKAHFTVTYSGQQVEIPLSASTTAFYKHIDIEIQGQYDITVDGVTYSLPVYLDDRHAMSIVLPDGEAVTGTGSFQQSSGQTEYEWKGSYSSQWDGGSYGTTTLLGDFSIGGTVLINEKDLKSALTEDQIQLIFGGYQTVTYNSAYHGVPAGTYYEVTFSDYHPRYNVCPGMGNSRGYDFEVDLSMALMKVTNQLLVRKYVVDEGGTGIYAMTTAPDAYAYRDPVTGEIIYDETEFSFTLHREDGSNAAQTQLLSGEGDTLQDIAEGYYYMVEQEKDGYIPVEAERDDKGNVLFRDDGSVLLKESGYIQYIQSESKEEGEIDTIIYVNMKLEENGIVALSKRVNDYTENGNYEGDYYKFTVYTEENGVYKQVDLDDTYLTDNGSVSFYLREGVYYLREDDMLYEQSGAAYVPETFPDDVTWTVSTGDTLQRVVSEEGDIYYRFEVTAKETTELSVINEFHPYALTDISVRKVDVEGAALSGASFTLQNESQEYYTPKKDGSAEWGTDETILFVDDTGFLRLGGLADGIYTLTEVTAPDGYSLLTDSILFAVRKDSVIILSPLYEEGETSLVSAGGTEITVKNVAGVLLPDTGGSTAYPYTTGSLLLMSCSAAAYLVYKKRRRKERIQ